MRIQKYLPMEQYTLVTRLSVEEVCRRLSEVIQPKSQALFSFSRPQNSKPYEGVLSGNQFVISRCISYRNSFLPEITGRMSTYPGQTEIAIKMRPVVLVQIFMIFWMGAVGLVCLLLTIATFFSKSVHFSPAVFIPYGMFGFGYALSYFAFKEESRRSRKFLAKLLEGVE